MSRLAADTIAAPRRDPRSAAAPAPTSFPSPAPATAPSARPGAATVPSPPAVARASALDRLARRLVLARLHALRERPLSIREGGAVHALGGDATSTPTAAGVPAEIVVRHPRFWRRLAIGGALGFAESWIAGEWTTDDLTGLLRTFARDGARADVADGGLAAAGRVAARLGHRLAAHTRRGSRRNIHAHYDIGNAFFETFLDETLTYSAALFERPGMSLADAQVAKLDRICRVLGLGPDDHVLEIGTGWGSFALHAAGRYGCRVTTTTISREQHELARRRVEAAGLADRVTLLEADYRDLDGTYDAVASIEMIEAVGHDFLPRYFGTIARCLKPGGRACVQAISMPDHRYEGYRRRADFIQRHVFPGSCCPSLAAISTAIARGSDLRITGLHDLGLDYAETLRLWHERFLAAEDRVRALGADDAFVRLWRYYLSYCEAGFAERYISVAQIALARTGGPAPADAGEPAGPAPHAARTRVPVETPGAGP